MLGFFLGACVAGEPQAVSRILIVASLSKQSGRGLREIGKRRAAILALGAGPPFFVHASARMARSMALTRRTAPANINDDSIRDVIANARLQEYSRREVRVVDSGLT